MESEFEESDIEIENEEEYLWDPNTAAQPSSEDEEVPLNLVPREEWGALPPKSKKDLPHPIRNVVFIYTNTDPCKSKEECIKTMQDMQKKHMEEEGLPDIQYNFYITEDLTVFEGRGWHVTSYQPNQDYADVDTKVLDIAYIGHYNDEPFPSVPVLQVRNALLDLGISQGYIYDKFNNYPTIVK